MTTPRPKALLEVCFTMSAWASRYAFPIWTQNSTNTATGPAASKMPGTNPQSSGPNTSTVVWIASKTLRLCSTVLNASGEYAASGMLKARMAVAPGAGATGVGGDTGADGF